MDDGIELLTGVEAGTRDRKGQWTPKSIGARVEAKLKHYAGKARAFSRGTRKKKAAKKKANEK